VAISASPKGVACTPQSSARPTPPLRISPGDIAAIARHFIAEHGPRFGRGNARLSAAAEAALRAHAWPGNVRELENAVQRALILAPGDTIEPAHLNLGPRPSLAAPVAVPVTEALEPGKKVDNMRDLEREHILRTLAEVGGSRKLAVERLGISERTLRYKLQQYRDEGYFNG